MHTPIHLAIAALVMTGSAFTATAAQHENPSTVRLPAQQPRQFESLSTAPSNSWWIETPDGGVVMFDAQRTLTDARALVEVIRKSGRPLRALFMTHPHPDHITGFGTVKAAFPNVAIYSTADATRYLEGKGGTLLGMNVKMFGTNATTIVPRPDVLVSNGQILTVGGLEIHVHQLGTGESEATTVYFIPSLQTLIAGDVTTPERTPFLAGAHTAAWLKQLALVRAKYDPATRVLPGHGPEVALKDAIQWQTDYLTLFRQLVGAAVARKSAGGVCVTGAETVKILSDMRRSFPTNEAVARMPPEKLDALNIQGVSFELSGSSCPGLKDPLE